MIAALDFQCMIWCTVVKDAPRLPLRFLSPFPMSTGRHQVLQVGANQAYRMPMVAGKPKSGFQKARAKGKKYKGSLLVQTTSKTTFTYQVIREGRQELEHANKSCCIVCVRRCFVPSTAEAGGGHQLQPPPCCPASLARFARTRLKKTKETEKHGHLLAVKLTCIPLAA